MCYMTYVLYDTYIMWHTYYQTTGEVYDLIPHTTMMIIYNDSDNQQPKKG